MKNVKRNSIIIGVVTAIVLYFVLKDNFKPTMELLISSNPFWMLLTVITYLGFLFLETLVFYKTVRVYKKGYSWKSVLEINMITKFFSGITPLATGGEPMQVVELKKDGIRVTDGTNVSIQNHITYQISIVFFGLIAIILNYSLHLFTQVKVLKELVLIGFIIHVSMLLLLLFVSFNKKFNKWIINFAIKILSKLNIVKDKDKKIDKLEQSCENFYNGALYLKKNKKEFANKAILRILSLAFYYALPFFIVKALGVEHNLSIWLAIVASSYVYLAGSYVPIPGASGGMEYVFLGFFGNYIGEPALAATLLVWRFITYFLPTILGGIIFNVREDRMEREKAKEIVEN